MKAVCWAAYLAEMMVILMVLRKVVESVDKRVEQLETKLVEGLVGKTAVYSVVLTVWKMDTTLLAF